MLGPLQQANLKLCFGQLVEWSLPKSDICSSNPDIIFSTNCIFKKEETKIKKKSLAMAHLQRKLKTLLKVKISINAFLFGNQSDQKKKSSFESSSDIRCRLEDINFNFNFNFNYILRLFLMPRPKAKLIRNKRGPDFFPTDASLTHIVIL